MDFLRQSWVLTDKTLKIIITRNSASTLYSALVLPILASVYLGIGQNFSQPNSKFGIADPHDILSLSDALGKSAGGRNTVALINNGHSGGDIDQVIKSVSEIITGAGKNATILNSQDELGYVCRSSIRGSSPCFGAIVFHSSPNEGSGKIWNYTLRADLGLGAAFKIDEQDNDAQVYVLPLQRAVDSAIAHRESGQTSFPEKTQQYPYTAMTEDEREDKVRRDYQKSFVNYLSVAFIMALIGVCYHMPGFIATERESGMSQLIDAMMPAKKGWHRQVARMMSHHNAFALTYLPGWVIASIICKATIWKSTSYGIMVVFFILSGMAITSMSLLSASFFKKAQLSGTITAVIWIALGIVAQVIPHPGTGAVIILSLLFTPCTFVFFIIYVARYEREGKATNLLHAPPTSSSNLPGIVLWIFLIIQTIVYPLLAAYLERIFHGVTTGERSSHLAESGSGDAVRIENMTKIYQPSLLRRIFSFVSPPRPRVVAVDGLTLTAKKGQILALLGANGSGKSTTLDAVAGISNYTSGNITIDTSGGLGIAPQKNVMWDQLTVLEHIQIFNKLKSPNSPATAAENEALIEAIGLKPKIKAIVKTLSGGQKRKLQLGMMLTGNSAVCCVDEVSSGIDPLSRRKIWDILLSERGSRTIIMTTHFLDEADLLADNIAILSKGTLRAEGSSVQLKDTFGAGYRIRVLDSRHIQHAPNVAGVERNIESNAMTYVASSSGLAAEVIRALEQSNIPYKFSGPTIEDVFLNLAEEAKGEQTARNGHIAPLPKIGKEKFEASEEMISNQSNTRGSLALLTGRPVGMIGQTGVFLRKRFTILKTNWVPYFIAFVIPIIAAAIIQILIKNKEAVGCRPVDLSSAASTSAYTDFFDEPFLVGGPLFKLGLKAIGLFKSIIPGQFERQSASENGETAIGNVRLKLVDSFSDFTTFIQDNRKNVTPAGLWLGDSGSPATLAFKVDKLSMYSAVIGQNLLNTLLANTSIATSYDPFDSPVAPSTGNSLQLVVYFALAASLVPGFFGLYPNVERRMNVRGLQYSSGARTVPVWLGHFIFDGSIIVVSMIITAVILITTSNIWYHGPYLVPVFILYGITSVLLSYLVSLLAGSSLATYAFVSVIQGVGFAIYFIAFLFILTYSPAASTDRNILLGHWVISIFFPVGSLIRAFFVGLNIFGTTCAGDALKSYPGAMTAYGGPILYLAMQSIVLFSLVIWIESGAGRYSTGTAKASAELDDPEIAKELSRVDADDTGGLQVKHLTKAFGQNTAVDNITFGVQHGEVFALLGPNGAGKSTTISLIRGDIAPSKGGGDVFVEKVSVSKKRPAARANLGVCPQFDAIDSMTVVEHLRHYAKLRGITDIDRQVQAVVEAVGLEAYTNVMAHTLSGGNKRKLSLAIALTGNPSVILLDEPSSGLDAAAKRIMWRTLEAIVPGRSILLTTHSMEEADALANRAGIMARRMLALGDTNQLRHRFGDTLHVHLVSKTAPHSTAEEMDHVRSWITKRFPGAEVEQATFHGQMRFSIPASAVADRAVRKNNGTEGEITSQAESAIGQLLIALEENKDVLGIAHHSVSPTTLNEVFLTIVGKHDVQEEGYAEAKKPWYKKRLMEFF